MTAADHRGHAVQRGLERQVERPVPAVHQHVRSGLDLRQGPGLRGEVVGAGAAACYHRAAEPGGGQPGLLVLDVEGGLPDQGRADLAAIPVHGVPFVRLQAPEAEQVVPGDPLGQRDQAGVAERQPAPSGADVQLDQHADGYAVPAGRSREHVYLDFVVDNHGQPGLGGGLRHLVKRGRVNDLIRDQDVGKPGPGQDQRLPGGLAGHARAAARGQLLLHQCRALVGLEVRTQGCALAGEERRAPLDVPVRGGLVDYQARRHELIQRRRRQDDHPASRVIYTCEPSQPRICPDKVA